MSRDDRARPRSTHYRGAEVGPLAGSALCRAVLKSWGRQQTPIPGGVRATPRHNNHQNHMCCPAARPPHTHTHWSRLASNTEQGSCRPSRGLTRTRPGPAQARGSYSSSPPTSNPSSSKSVPPALSEQTPCREPMGQGQSRGPKDLLSNVTVPPEGGGKESPLPKTRQVPPPGPQGSTDHGSRDLPAPPFT